MDLPPSPVGNCPSHSCGGQLTFLTIDDPAWVTLLLRHLERGGVVWMERSGDLVILPLEA